ncbi:MAG: hypothetical protein IJC20_02385 [Clostridia bacterium]|nr:hypothetical protein [Clostridia bacterium]
MILFILFIFAVGCICGYALSDKRNKAKTKNLLDEKDRTWLRHCSAVNDHWNKVIKEISMRKIVVNDRKYYVELDRIRLIYEDDELVGWYNPNGKVE